MDMRAADLGLMLALDALLAERNVTRAAKRMNLSQPAMSAQLARLRALFNDTLLVQSGRSMVPTARALELQQPLHDLLDDLSRLIAEQRPFDPATASRTFSIIAADYVHTIVSIPLIEAVRAVAPGTKIALLPFDPATAWEKLERLEADVLLAWREVTPESARARRLYSDTLCLVQRIDHPRGKGDVTIDDLCALDHVTIAPEGSRMHGPLDQRLAIVGRKRNVVASVPSFLMAPSCIANSNLVAAVPRLLAEKMRDKLEVYDLPFAVMRYDILAAWHPRTQNDPAQRWLRDMICAPFVSARDDTEA